MADRPQLNPYNPAEPFIKAKLEGSLFDRLVEAGFPLARAMQYFHENPEEPIQESLKLAAEDVVPFYGNYRNGGDWSDYAKEAVLMFSPAQINKYRHNTYKPDPTRKYYAAENPNNHSMYIDSPNYPNTVESIPAMGDGISTHGMANMHEVDPVKYIEDKQRLAQSSIDAARLTPTRYEAIGDIQLQSNKRHYSYGELVEKERKLKEQLDKFNWKRGLKRNFKIDPLTPDEQNKIFKLQNELNEIKIELNLSDYKSVIDNTYGPYYDDLGNHTPYSPRDYDQSWSYDLTNDRKDINKIK